MKFSIFKKNKKESTKRPQYVNMRPRIDNSKVIAQAKKRKQVQFLNQRKESVPSIFKSLPFRKIFFSGSIIFVVLGGLYFFRTTSIFNINEVVVITDKPEDYSGVKSIVDEYKGKNIIFLSNSEIEKKIKQKFNSIHTVFVDRSLNGILKVEVIEDIPIYYEANNSGIYLINQSGVVMEIVPPKVTLEFDETEKLIKDNRLPLDSDQVRVKYLSKFDEAERSKIIWKDVSKEEKEATLSQMEDELNSKINDFTNKLSDQLKEDKYKNLIGSYIPNNQTYKVGDTLSLDSLNFVSIVLDFVKSKNFVASKVLWDTDYTIQVVLQDNPAILFSVKRSYSSQFADLNTLIYHGQFNGAKIVDVRSSNYSVVR